MRVFEHNFIEDKEKVRRNTSVFQGLSTQQSVKFAGKMRAISYENKFLPPVHYRKHCIYVFQTDLFFILIEKFYCFP